MASILGAMASDVRWQTKECQKCTESFATVCRCSCTDTQDSKRACLIERFDTRSRSDLCRCRHAIEESTRTTHPGNIDDRACSTLDKADRTVRGNIDMIVYSTYITNANSKPIIYTCIIELVPVKRDVEGRRRAEVVVTL